jgi:hypothetical protein
MYANWQGRFTGVDPLLASAVSMVPQSWNRYVYVQNNPLRLVDISGEFPIEVHIRSFAPFDWFGAGMWKGDGAGRRFSTDFSESSKIHQITHFETTDKKYNTEAFGRLSESAYGAKAYSEAVVEKGGKGKGRILTHVSGNNDALIPGIDGGPSADIDIKSNINVFEANTKAGRVVTLSGKISGDGFPSAEAFVSDKKGNKVFLGAFATSSGPSRGPFLTLLGEGSTPMINVNLSIVVKNGVFQGVLLGRKVVSIDEWNRQFQEKETKK